MGSTLMANAGIKAAARRNVGSTMTSITTEVQRTGTIGLGFRCAAPTGNMANFRSYRHYAALRLYLVGAQC